MIKEYSHERELMDENKHATDTAQSACNGLLACPFCGGQAKIRKRKTVIVECSNCHVLFIKMTEDEAVASWNKRCRNIKAKKVPYSDAEGRVVSIQYIDHIGRRCTLFVTSGSVNQTDKVVNLINNEI